MKDPDTSGLDCYALPRGRVLYNEKTRKSEILDDRNILEKNFLVTRIVQEFHLEKSNGRFLEDEHYRCAICENENYAHSRESD
ncbi:MAG: hypothetical protein ACLP5H_24635 [Desulfomonilaceae bacterium]